MTHPDRRELSLERPRSLQQQIGRKAAQRAPLGFLHTADHFEWSPLHIENIANIYMAGLREPQLGVSVQQRLLKPEHPEVEVRWDRLADVYEEAFSSINKQPQTVRTKLIGSASWFPYEDMGLFSASRILGTLVSTCGREAAPVIPYRFDPIEALNSPANDYAMDLQNANDHMYFANIVRMQPYFREGVTMHDVTMEIAEWAMRESGGMAPSLESGTFTQYYADKFLPDVFEALEPFPEEQLFLAQSMVNGNVSLRSVIGYISKNIEAGSNKADALNTLISEQRPDQLIAAEGFEMERAGYSLAQGEVTLAVEHAKTLSYTEHCDAMLRIAREQHKRGEQEAAIRTVDDVYSLDPADLAQASDGEEQTRTRDDMWVLIRDSFTDTAIEVGAIEQAVTAFNEKLERDHKVIPGDTSNGDQTAADLFGMKVADSSMGKRLLTYLSTRQDIPLERRLRLATAMLRAVNEKNALEGNTGESLQPLHALAEPLITEACAWAEESDNPNANSLAAILLIQTGRIDEGLQMRPAPEDAFIMDEITSNAILAATYIKRPEEALTVYTEQNGPNMSDYITSKAQSAILTSSLLHGDYETMKKMIDSMFPRDVNGTLSLLYGRFRDKHIPPAPDLLVEKFMEESQTIADTNPGEYLKQLAWFIQNDM